MAFRALVVEAYAHTCAVCGPPSERRPVGARCRRRASFHFRSAAAVPLNLARFPADFMFRLTPEESRSLLFQSGISMPRGRGGRQVPPFGFTEHGIAIRSSVLG